MPRRGRFQILLRRPLLLLWRAIAARRFIPQIFLLTARSCRPAHPSAQAASLRWVALSPGKCSAVERLTFIRKEVTLFRFRGKGKVSRLSPWRKYASLRWVALSPGKCSAVERLTFIRKVVTLFRFRGKGKVSRLSPSAQAASLRWVALSPGKCSAVERLTFIRKEVTLFRFRGKGKVSRLSPWRMQPSPVHWRTCALLVMVILPPICEIHYLISAIHSNLRNQRFRLPMPNQPDSNANTP